MADNDREAVTCSIPVGLMAVSLTETSACFILEGKSALTAGFDF